MKWPIIATLVAAFVAASVCDASINETDPGIRRISGVGFEESLDTDSVIAPACRDTGADTFGFPLFITLRVPREAVELKEGAKDPDLLDRRITAYAECGNAQLLLALDATSAVQVGSNPDGASAQTWRRALTALSKHYRERIHGYVLDLTHESRPASELSYLVKLTALAVRAGDPRAQMALLVDTEAVAQLRELYATDVAAYVDAVFITGTTTADAADADTAELVSLVTTSDPTADLVLASGRLAPESARRELLTRLFRNLGTGIGASSFRATDTSAAAEALDAAKLVGDVIRGDLLPIEASNDELHLLLDDREATNTIPHQLLYGVASGTTVVAFWGEPGQEGTVTLQLVSPPHDRPQLRDLATGRQGPVRSFTRDESTRTSRVTVGLQPVPRLLVLKPSASQQSATISVESDALPTVAEIIAKHQQAQVRQDELVSSYIASAVIELHFRPSSTTQRFDVISENRYYFDALEGAEWEEISFTLNGTRWGSNRPAFPLLQPEKVLALPLKLELERGYSYRLEGIGRVGDRPCYIVRFEPIGQNRSMYRGKVWIDRATFVKLKVESIQTELSDPVMSNAEVYTYEQVGERDGTPVWLLSDLTSRQLYLIAGRDLLVEKIVRLDDFILNPSDFSARRATARTSDHIMLRETDSGLRYFVKRGGERVVSEKLTQSARALALGVAVDPSFDYPLPIAGINYIDFDFLGKDTQLAVLFGGVLALGTVQRSRLFGLPLDLSGDLFAIAVEGNDLVFAEAGEVAEQALRTRPLNVGLNLGWRLFEYHKLRAGYRFQYDWYRADDSTAEDFVVPSGTSTNSTSLGYELQRAGLSLSTSWTWSKRTSWRPWGDPTSFTNFDPTTRSYLKYSASLAKDFHLSALQTLHVDASYYGGDRLDRFSRYQFGLFAETKIQGVPAAGVRFDELYLARASYSFNLFDQYRFDLSIDQAMGRDPNLSAKLVYLGGAGIGINLRGPWNTLIRADCGKSFLPTSYRGAGSVVGQILILKPL